VVALCQRCRGQSHPGSARNINKIDRKRAGLADEAARVAEIIHGVPSSRMHVTVRDSNVLLTPTGRRGEGSEVGDAPRHHRQPDCTLCQWSSHARQGALPVEMEGHYFQVQTTKVGTPLGKFSVAHVVPGMPPAVQTPAYHAGAEAALCQVCPCEAPRPEDIRQQARADCPTGTADTATLCTAGP